MSVLETEALIDRLSATVRPAPAWRLTVRTAGLTALGTLAVALLAYTMLDSRALLDPNPVFWVRDAILGLLTLSLVLLVGIEARAGSRLSLKPLLPASLGLLALAAGTVLEQATAPSRGPEALVLGQMGPPCAVYITVMGLVVLVTTLAALRSASPTRPIRAGLFAGLLSGTLAALVYARFCSEPTFGFVAVWYLMGIGFSGLAGALLGPLVLRWKP